MTVSTNETADEDFAWAIAAVPSEHLGKPPELVVDGKAPVAHAGDDPDREDMEEILSGGPDRGHEKVTELGTLFIRDRLKRIFNTTQGVRYRTVLAGRIQPGFESEPGFVVVV